MSLGTDRWRAQWRPSKCGRGKLEAVTLEKAIYTIGSDAESADIKLSDSTVSRVHAVLERVGTAWLLRDVGSRNGTRVNSEADRSTSDAAR